MEIKDKYFLAALTAVGFNHARALDLRAKTV